MRGWMMWIALLSTACVRDVGPTDPSERGDDDDDDDTGDADQRGCETDEDCPVDAFCDVDTCVEGDRDNSFAEASPIFQNETRSGVIAPAGDVDRFVYTSLGPEWLRIQTVTGGDPGGTLDTVVRVFASNGAEHAVMDNFPTGRVSTYDTVLVVYLPRADTWYVTVEDITTYYTSFFDAEDWRGGPDAWYELSLEGGVGTTGEVDAMTSPSATIDITSGASIWYVGVRLESPGDSDWIAVEHPFDGQPLDVFGHSAIPGSPARARVRLFDPVGDLVLEKDDLGASGQASYFDAPAGSYALEATDVLGAGGPDNWYVVYLRTYDEGAAHPYFGSATYETEVEPNDVQGAAQLYTVTETTIDGVYPYQVQHIQGRFDDPGDIDWYEVTTSTGEQVTFRCFAELFGSLTDLEARLFDGVTDITPTGQGSTATPLGQYLANVEVPGPGTYQIRLTSPSGVSGSGAYYRCRILQAQFDFSTE